MSKDLKTTNEIPESVDAFGDEAKGEAEDKMTWTPEQQDAIERRGENLLVAAAAGSGKTSVMVERIRRMVSEEDVPVDSLLVVTFTNAAAAEMKDKIRRSLAEALDKEDPSTERSKTLRTQIRNLPLAQISTFHAFGMSVIKRFFYLTDVDPGTRVGDDTECSILRDKALDELIEEEFEEGRDDFIEFMDDYSGDRSDYAVRNLILEASKRIGAMPHGMEWARARISEMENIRESFKDTAYWRILKSDIETKLEKAISLTKDAVEILDDVGLIEKSQQLIIEEITRYEAALDILGRDKEPEDVMREVGEILSCSIPNFNPPKGELKEVFDGVKASVKALRDEARAIVRDKLVKEYFSTDLSDMLLETELDAKPLSTLLRLVERFNDIYSDAKKDEGIMDFDDIEHLAFDILEKEEAQEYYRNKFKYIFVDEYQDTNLMQEAIIGKVKGEDNLFMVGDIKQSIYQFRLAEPSIFKGKYDSFKSDAVEKSGVIDLNRNHRSKAPILEFINSIFRNIMDGYDKDAELYPGITYDGELLRKPEIHVLMSKQNVIEDESREGVDAVENKSISEEDKAPEREADPELWDKVYLEAKHVARIIKENIGKPFFDIKAKQGPKERPLEKRDIVVLMRSVSSYANLYSQALQEEGIDAYLEGDDGYFDTLEIGAFLNLLSVIDNIKNDIPLLGVLHSGIFGFTSKELAEIRVLCKEGSFSEAFLKLAEPVSDEMDETGDLRAKCREVLSRIRYWQDLALTMPLSRYIWKLMLESNCYITMGALPRGGARQVNLRALCDMAEKYERERQATLYGFLNYVGAVKAGRVKTPEVSRLGEGDDVVRIMTIHKSKGLEFPMVVVSSLGSQKRYGESGTFNMHKDIGLALTLKSGKNHWEKKIMIQSMISAVSRNEAIEEEIRILYVALTRAMDILYLVGYEDKDITEFAENGIMSNTQYLKMILPGQEYKTFYVSADSNDDSKGKNANAAKKPRDENGEAGTQISERDKEDKAVGIPSEKEEAILERLNYTYPYEAGRKLKSKYSVTQLNKMKNGEEDSAPISKTVFLQSGSEDEGGILADVNRSEDERGIVANVNGSKERVITDGLSAAEVGTIYHKILERLDFSKCDDKYIDSAVNEMVERGILSSDEMAVVDLKKINDFFDSEIGSRARSAAVKGMLEKERPFTLMLERDGHNILVQGVIDCYFSEGDGPDRKTVLLDYKNSRIYKDRPIEEEIARMVKTYEGQLTIYREALLEAGMGPVDEVYLYLLDIGRAIRI